MIVVNSIHFADTHLIILDLILDIVLTNKQFYRHAISKTHNLFLKLYVDFSNWYDI